MAAKMEGEGQSFRQREAPSAQALAGHLAYWKQHLAGAPAGIDFPADHPRPPVSTARSTLQQFVLPTHLRDALQTLSQNEGASLFTTLLAAFGILLSRYSGQEDIVIGALPSGGSARQGLQTLSVPDDTLALRTDLSGNPSFRQLLKRVLVGMDAALEHADISLETIIQALQAEHALEEHHLFQALFTLDSSPSDLPAHHDNKPSEPANQHRFVDLRLTLRERPESLSGSLAYNTDLFEAATIERMIGHWQTLLEGIVANPDQPIGNLPLLTESEQRLVLVDWTATQADYPQNVCIHQLFEQQVARTPAATAVVYDGAYLTFRQLNERANQLAHYLRQLGVGPEVLVGLCVERSLDMVVGLLGILKAGGAYVPFDPTYPQERLAFMLADSGVSVLVMQAAFVERLPTHQAKVVCLDTDWETIAQQSQDPPVSGLTADNLVYMIYTSGSTGKPKGVLITHKNLVHSTSARLDYYVDPVKSFLLLSSFAFDSSVAGIFWTLCQGGALVLPRQGEERDPAQLIELITRHHISHLLCLPSLYTLLLAQAQPAQLASLRNVIVAGEACPDTLPKQHAQVLPQAALFNEYGPTEGTVWCSVYCCQPQEHTTNISIGRPIENTQIYVLDAHLQPLPIGVPGELYLGGDGLARGYLNRPELTAERFIAHPLSAEPGARLYKTGDLVRWRPDGNLEFLGRIDHQVKIRGFRIELGEIEAALTQHPAVREVAMLVREDTPGDKRLVAYVVPASGEAPTNATLRSYLKTRLPDYMLPASFVFLEAMPLNPNGKLDRKALPAPAPSSGQPGENFVAPRTLTEERLAAIWGDLLGSNQIGVYDNFFELGGDSLMVLRALTQIQERFQVDLPLASFLDSPTVRELSDQIEQLLIAKIETMSEEEVQLLLGN